MKCFLIRSQSERVHKVECLNSLGCVVCRSISINHNKHGLTRGERRMMHISNDAPSSGKLSMSCRDPYHQVTNFLVVKMAIPFEGKQCRFPFLPQCPNRGTYQIPVCLEI
ncbi:hypothetical protein V8G54_026403 [Vigna mungo]|uniref:Uncharacterized protein n=1 Tax=Vigna mungo TaxID=3915 RepID=A0AAQ3RPV9_VIGMU